MAGGLAERSKELFRKYGRVALGVHFTVYFSFLAGGCRSGWGEGACGWLAWGWRRRRLLWAAGFLEGATETH